MKRTIQGLLSVCVCLFAGFAKAQVPLVINSELFVGPSLELSTIANECWIGPAGSIVLAGGKWNHWVKRQWISSSATLSGTLGGEWIFNDPSGKGMTAGAITIDGNAGNFIAIPSIRISNPMGVTLESIVSPPNGWADVPTSSTLKLNGILNLAVDGANIVLGQAVTGNLYLGSSGDLINGGVNRMVVTNNSLNSYLVKDNTSGWPFLFPVGIQSGDYTPATIAGTDVYHVSVQDYAQSATSAPVAVPSEGMDRTWHIFADAGSAATVKLQHNLSTNGVDYIDTDAFVTQFSNGTWSSSAAPDYVSAGVHQKAAQFVLQGTGNLRTLATGGVFLSKTSDASSPLPVTLVNFSARLEEAVAILTWQTVVEKDFDRFDIEVSTDGVGFRKIGSLKGSGAGGEYNYGISQVVPLAYYRLKMVDKDETYTYSSIRALGNLNRVRSFFPNPASDLVSIHVSKSYDVKQIRIIDARGIVVYRQSGFRAGSIAVDRLSTGVYSFVLEMNDGSLITDKIAITR